MAPLDGINIVQANGEGAAQSVPHFHLHVLPRRLGDELKMNWGLVPGDMDEIAAMAEKIQGRAGLTPGCGRDKSAFDLY